MQAPPATTCSTSKVHEENAHEVLSAYTASASASEETSESRASPDPRLECERLRERLESESAAALSRLEQLSSRASFLEAELHEPPAAVWRRARHLVAREGQGSVTLQLALLAPPKTFCNVFFGNEIRTILPHVNKRNTTHCKNSTADVCHCAGAWVSEATAAELCADSRSLQATRFELELLRGHRALVDSSRAASLSLTSFAMFPIARSTSPAPAFVADELGSTLAATSDSSAAEGVAHRSFASPDIAELVLVAGPQSGDPTERAPPPPPRNGHSIASASLASKYGASLSAERRSSRGSSGEDLDVPITPTSHQQMQSHVHSFALPLALDITTSSC